MDNVIHVASNNSNFWSYSDILKSVTHIMKGNEKDQYYRYDEFGKTITPFQNGVIATRFAGKRLISETEDYDFVFRTYNSKAGRFLQRDPSGYIDGSNLYTYCSNNPLSRTDPFGTDARSDRSPDPSADITNSDLYKRLKNYDEKGVLQFVAGTSLNSIESFRTEYTKNLRNNPPLNVWWASLSDDQLREYYKFPWAQEEFDARVNLNYKHYLQRVETKLVEGFRRTDTASNLSSLIGGITMSVSFGFLNPTAAAGVGAYDAGVTIPELFTGKSSGIHAINLLTGQIGPVRPLTTGETILGVVNLTLFALGMASESASGGGEGVVGGSGEAGGGGRGGNLRGGASGLEPPEVPATVPVGRQGSPLPRPPYQPRGNYGTNVSGRYYTGHALDRMQERGFTPTVVEEAIQHGCPSLPNDDGSILYEDPVNGTTVVVSSNNSVITVW